MSTSIAEYLPTTSRAKIAQAIRNQRQPADPTEDTHDPCGPVARRSLLQARALADSPASRAVLLGKPE